MPKKGEQEYLILKSQSESLEDLIGRLLFRLLEVQDSVDARMNGLSKDANAHHAEVLKYEHSTALHGKIVEELTKKVVAAIREKEIDLSDVIAGLVDIESSVDEGNEQVLEKLSALVEKTPDIQKGLNTLAQAVKENKPDAIVFDELIESQEAGFAVLGKLLVSLTTEIKKEKTSKVTIAEPVEIKEPKWWKPSFSWEPLEKLLDKISKRTFKVSQAEPFEVTIKGLPKEIADALGKEIQRVMPRAMPGAGYNNPFSFTADGSLKVSGGAAGGGDASEATLQAILAAVDTLEANTTGIATEATLSAIAGSLDTVETKLQSIIDKSAGSAILKKTVALTGSGTVHDPALGKKIRLYSIKFSLSADMTDVSFDFGAGSAFEKYLAPKTGGLYGWNTHPDYVEGAIDENLDCVITGTGTVQINIEYIEV